MTYLLTIISIRQTLLKQSCPSLALVPSMVYLWQVCSNIQPDIYFIIQPTFKPKKLNIQQKYSTFKQKNQNSTKNIQQKINIQQQNSTFNKKYSTFNKKKIKIQSENIQQKIKYSTRKISIQPKAFNKKINIQQQNSTLFQPYYSEYVFSCIS